MALPITAVTPRTFAEKLTTDLGADFERFALIEAGTGYAMRSFFSLFVVALAPIAILSSLLLSRVREGPTSRSTQH